MDLWNPVYYDSDLYADLYVTKAFSIKLFNSYSDVQGDLKANHSGPI